jgi:hypothetical protein
MVVVKPKQLRPKVNTGLRFLRRNSLDGPQNVKYINAKRTDISGYTEDGISIDHKVSLLTDNGFSTLTDDIPYK